MTVSIGSLVRHPLQPWWGHGKIVAIEAEHLHVYFPAASEGGRAKRLPTTTVLDSIEPLADDPLTAVTFVRKDEFFYAVPADEDDEEDDDAAAKSAGKAAKEPKTPPPATHAAAVARFKAIFPAGFEDPEYLEKERDYKLKGVALWQELLGNGQAAVLLKAGNIEELVRRAQKVESKVGVLLSQFEKAAMRDGFKDHAAAKGFFEALLRFIDASNAEAQAGFEALVAATAKLPVKVGGVLKWPIVTVFPFMADPKRQLFVKPEPTKLAAQWMGFGLNYESKPNWETYKNALELAAKTKTTLEAPRELDMIDIQSFWWVASKFEDYKAYHG